MRKRSFLEVSINLGGCLGMVRIFVNVKEGVLISVVRAMVKGGEGVGKPSKLKSDRSFDEGPSLNAPIKGKKSSLLTMICLNKMGKRNPSGYS